MTRAVRDRSVPSELGCEPIATSGWTTGIEEALWPRLVGSVTADVAIIGGGYVGLNAALHLALAGRDVRLVEAREIGWGASGRNCAHAVPTWGVLRPSQVEQRFGEAGRAMNRRIAASGRALADLIDEHAIDCDARLQGQANLTSSPKVVAALPDLVAEWQAVGGDIELIDPHAVRDIADSPNYRGGYVLRSGGSVQPLKLARGLATAAARYGVQVHEQSPALTLQPAGAGWRLTMPEGDITARTVIVATNGYTGDLWPRLGAVGYPVTAGMLISSPLGEAQRAVMPAGMPFSDMDDPTLFSGLLTADGRYATSVLPGPSAPTLERLARIVDGKFARTFPGVQPPRWERHWFGRLLMTPSKLPMMLDLAPGLHAGLGCNGFGICGGSMLGQELARLVRDEPADRPVLPLQQPATAPLHRLFPFLFRNVLTPALRRLH